MDKTFESEDKLPNLPVPSLQNTLLTYLESVKAVATNDEFENTKKICEEFRTGLGEKLQKKLQERAESQRNWVERWWLETAYLEQRFPLPYMNFSGVTSYPEYFWPLEDGTQIPRMAFSLHILAMFWQLLRNEGIPPHRSGVGQPLSMDQLRTAFNTCRIPFHGMDEITNHFITCSEGDCPSHTVVICRGYFFKLNLIEPESDQPYTPPQIEKALRSIEQTCRGRAQDAAGVAALTSLQRNKWAAARSHMMEISDANKKMLHEIESAIHVVSMDWEKVEPNNGSIIRHGMCGNPIQRWRDKSYNEVWCKNGSFSSSCDHAALDGMVMVLFIEFTMTILKPCNGVWRGSMECDRSPATKELVFHLDEQIYDAIKEGKKTARVFDDDIQLLLQTFNKFGKLSMKKLKVVPDMFAQICIQLAYMRMYGKPAATYETATTRKFYHGRTETCRTCTPELVAFCKAAIHSGNNNDPEVIRLLQTAHDKGVQNMRSCSDGKGCDRHLFGLSIIAKECGIPLPELYTDPMYAKTGGGGNFVLSTSFVGYFNCSGVVAPMVDDGYGFFYRINDHTLQYVVSAWKHSDTTNCQQFAVEFEKALWDVLEMFESKSQL